MACCDVGVMLGRVESCGVNMLNCLIVTVDNLRWQYIFNKRKENQSSVLASLTSQRGWMESHLTQINMVDGLHWT